MSKTARKPAADPTLPHIEILLDGTKYDLCFTFGALALAQKQLRVQGIIVNLLHALDLSSLDAERVVPLLYAALITHQPDISIEAVAKLVTMRNLGNIFEGVAKAYGESLAEPSPEDVKPDPTKPE
jgi:hypothetical protein